MQPYQQNADYCEKGVTEKRVIKGNDSSGAQIIMQDERYDNGVSYSFKSAKNDFGFPPIPGI